MTDAPQSPKPADTKPQAKKAYHAPDLRDFGTVKDLTLTGGNGLLDSQLAPEYATGSVN